MTNKNPYIEVKDYSVSGDVFQLRHHSEYDYLETTPKPTSEELPEYYKSEDYISHTNSKRNLFEKAYHIIRSISLKRKLKLINSFKSEEKTLLDIGCGTGSFLQTAKKEGWKVVGIEPNPQAREIANLNTNQSVFNTEHLSELESSRFDVITLWHVLEHLPNLEEQLATIKKLLKPNGTLIIAVPNYKSYDAKHYKQFWAAFDVPRHLWHFSQTAIHKLVAKKQMMVVNTLPMIFDAFYVSLLSEKYKTKRMRPFHAFYVGLVSNIKAKQTTEYSSLIYCIKNS